MEGLLMLRKKAAANHIERTEGAPTVSVIVPAYNTSQYIKEALDSVLAQTLTDYEIIVINDGSLDTDELEHALEPYLARIIYLKQENRGSSGARNAGLRVARGRYIALLDSDDVWEPEYLAVNVGLLERDPAIDVVFPNSLLFGESPDAGMKYMDLHPVEGEVTFTRLLAQQCYVWGGVTARREAILDAGMFDESLGSGEDFELWLRILHRGGRIAYHRQVLARYRKRPGSHTSDPLWLCRNFLKILDKITRTMKLAPVDDEVVERQRAWANAMVRLYEGKQAFFRGDASAAIEGLTEANAFFGSRKIALTLWLLRSAPRLLLRAYDVRDRFVLKTNTKF
jgi:GT2 family glycosyltransferase